MRLTTRQNGIISYAGLDADALWAGAKRAFSQSDGPVPERFLSFLPIFPSELIVCMSYVGAGGRMASPMGFSTDPHEYHEKLCEEMPDLYVGDNYRRCFDYDGRFKGGVVTVDAAWATRFPQYRPFQGEKLTIHMIGGGHQAVAVPESVFPRGGGVLESAERELRITARCEHFCEYARRRIVMGERYDPARFEEDYLRQFELSGVCIRQRELSRVMQDLCILRGLQDGGDDGPAMFTESALRAGGVRQYVPWRYACDTFEPEPVTRGTARLMQLYFEQNDPVGDLWLPYQDASAYIDRQRMTLNVRALCEGFQIAPAYDAQTHGGRYPGRVRVVVVRDRDIRPMVADTLNNPAYGSGMGPMGMLNKLVFLSDSRELMRQGRLMPETLDVSVENTTTDAESFRRMCDLAALQEWKGRLLDALYRRESALAQMQPATSAYERADELLSQRVSELERRVEAASRDKSGGQLSGYDADIDYLRRMQRHREGVPEDEPDPMPFSPDPLRELCIESGYAMRGSVRSFPLDALLLPAEPEAEETDCASPAPEGSDRDGREGRETGEAREDASEEASVSVETGGDAKASGARGAAEGVGADGEAREDASEEEAAVSGETGGDTNASGSRGAAQSVDADGEAREGASEEADVSGETGGDANASGARGAAEGVGVSEEAREGASEEADVSEETVKGASRPARAPKATPTEGKVSHAAKVRQKKKQNRLRFEQIDMFGGAIGKSGGSRGMRPVSDAAGAPTESERAREDEKPDAAGAPPESERTREDETPEAAGTSPQSAPTSHESDTSYVRRSLAQLTGSPRKAEMSKMARLINQKTES